MAPKDEKIKNLPMASEEKTESSDDDSTSKDVTNVKKSSSEEESESSDEESKVVEELKKKEFSSSKMLAKKIDASKSSALKTTTKPSYVVAQAEKRSLEKTEEKSKKKVKESSSKDVNNEEKPKQNLFARKFSEEDELVLLQGIIDFTATSGNPAENMDAFYRFVKESISFDVTRDQLVTKIRNLRRKFDEKVLKSLEKGNTEEEQIVFLKAFDKTCFDISRKIWGVNGVLPSKSRMMHQGKLVKKEEDEEPERYVKSTSLSFAQQYASFMKVENPTCTIDEDSWIASWDKVKEGPKKRELEEKFKKLKASQVELAISRIGVIHYAATTIFNQDKSSSSDM